MKRVIVIFCTVLLTFLLSGCFYSKSDLEEARINGYEEGYQDGYSAAEAEIDDQTDTEWNDGYNTGYEEALHELQTAMWNALDAAREETGWSVYEAWNSARLYLGAPDYYNFGVPNSEEIKEIIECLAIFAEYLDESNLFDF